MRRIVRARRNTKDYTGRTMTEYKFSLYNDNESYADVKTVLDRVEGVTALIKDAVIRYVRSDEFNLQKYEGPGHHKA